MKTVLEFTLVISIVSWISLNIFLIKIIFDMDKKIEDMQEQINEMQD